MASPTTIVTGLLVLLAVSSANASRITRQASRCKAGIQCVPLNNCPSIGALLSNPSRQNLIKVREALCSSDRSNLKVCCDSSSTPGVTPPGPTDPVTSQTPPPPTDPITPGGGERLLPTNCGQMSSTDRVFNGENVPHGAYPWMAILGYRGVRGEVSWGCGGALINNRYIVTAAHCVLPDLPIEEVRLGEHDLNTNPDCLPDMNACSNYQSFKVTRSQIVSHASYDTRAPISDDIALIRLDRPATFNSFVKPICLPRSNLNVRSFLNTRQAFVAGWGRTETGSRSDVLKRVQIPMVNIEQCQPIYENQLLPAHQLCFGGEAERDSCNGDSGGPVFHADSRTLKYQLIGVVSFGKKCGGDPAIYTNVAAYRSWIVQNLRP